MSNWRQIKTSAVLVQKDTGRATLIKCPRGRYHNYLCWIPDCFCYYSGTAKLSIKVPVDFQVKLFKTNYPDEYGDIELLADALGVEAFDPYEKNIPEELPEENRPIPEELKDD